MTLSETLHCNGEFRYGGTGDPVNPDPVDPDPVDPVGSVLVVRALGDTGEEVMEVRVGGVVVESFDVSTDFVSYEVAVPAGTAIGDIAVAFVNNATRVDFDRNLEVDWVELDGVRFETEADETTSTGTFNEGTGCDPSSVTLSETLHCNGEFSYA